MSPSGSGGWKALRLNVFHGCGFETRANCVPLPHSRFSIYFPILKSQKVAKLPCDSKGKAGWRGEAKGWQACKDDSFQQCQPQKSETAMGWVVRLLAECHQLPESQPPYPTRTSEPNKAMLLWSLFADKREMGK